MAAGTGGVCLTKRDKPMLVPPYFGLSLSQFDMKNVTAKGIICFLGLLVVSMWLLAHSGKQEGVVEKLVLLLMFLLSDGFFFFCEAERQKTAFQSFCEQEGHKTVVQSYHFYGRLSTHYCLCLQHQPFALEMVPLSSLLFCFLTEISHLQVLG